MSAMNFVAQIIGSIFAIGFVGLAIAACYKVADIRETRRVRKINAATYARLAAEDASRR